MAGDSGGGSTRGRQRHAERELVLRSWRIPVLAAVLLVTVWPLTGAVVLVAVFVAFGWDSPSADLVLASATALLYLGAAVYAVRAVRARIVVTAAELRVHNVASTTRIRWAEVEAVEEVTVVNMLALGRPLWHGTKIRVRRRRRPVGVAASWHPDEERATALRKQIRPPGP